MARKGGKRDNRYIAKLVTEDRAPCAFCRRVVDDEVTYGNLYAIGGIQCHYLCILLSCCLVQKGSEDSGLFGFMYEDILAELERSKKHKCSFCGCGGANLGCSVSSCRKQFHLPCGRERNAVSLFYGSYKSFCQAHAPKQKIPEHIMCKAKLRMKDDKNKNILKKNADNTEEDIVCVICYESVDAFPTINTFWPPCCARDAWFHRSCVQRMALSAGMHYLKCPLCNDKENFYDAVVSQGYYVPDRDAAWELEQNAFAEIYERPLTCTSDICQCPMGREHDADQGMWSIKLCLLCGSVGAHIHCIGASETTRYVCLTCTPAKPTDMQALTDNIDKLILQEQANTASNARHGPVMPSRMSLRRTKGRIPILDRPSCSGAYNMKTECESSDISSIDSSRQELNLKTPRRKPETLSPKRRTLSYKSPEKTPNKQEKSNDSYKSIEPVSYKSVEPFKTEVKMSPMKVLEQRIRDRVVCMGGNVLDERVVDMMKCRFRKPRPLCVKKKIVDEILKDFLNNVISPLKQKEQLREWCSPKKCCDISEEKNNHIRASDNTTKASENTGENKENRLQETPGKIKKIQHSTPRKMITSPRSGNSKEKSTATNYTPEKEVVNEINALDAFIKELSEEKHDAIEDVGNITNAEIKEDDEEHLANAINETDATLDDSSNSTFELPSEFKAEAVSDDSCFTFASPKRKTIEMKDSSLEISEQDHSVNIDVIKIPDSPASSPDVKKCAFKFSRLDKEGMEDKFGIDLESFKKGYLSEVDREYKCSFHHNHNTNKLNSEKNKVRTIIDFALDAHQHKHNIDAKNVRKRKLSEGGLYITFDKEAKIRKMSESDQNFSGDDFEVKKKLSYKKDGSPAKKVVQDKKSDRNKINKKGSRQRRRERENRERKCILEKKSNDEALKQKRNLLDRKLEGKKQRIEENLVKKIKSNDKNPKVFKEINMFDREIEGTELIEIRRNEIKDKCTKKVRFNNGKPLKEEIKKTMIDRKLDEREEIIKIRKEEIKEKLIKKSSSKDKKRENRKLRDEKIALDKEKENKTTIQMGTGEKHGKTECKEFKKQRKHESKEKRISASNNEESLKDKINVNEETKKRKDKKLKRSDKHEKNKKHGGTEKYTKRNDGRNIEVTIDSSESKLNQKTKLSIKNSEKDISVKIKWKKKHFRLKIESKKDKVEKYVQRDNSKFKQYVLQYFSEISPKQVLVKPEQEVSPLKRKYVKQEKTPDNLKQMSISNFFKVKSPE